MTKALEDAFHEASRLSDSEQDSLAAAIRAEIFADDAWERSLASSQDVLDTLAKEALSEHRDGKTKPLELDRR